MRSVATALAFMALLGCDQMPGMGASTPGGMLTKNDLQQILQSGMLWCYDYAEASQSCTHLERLREVNRQGFSINQNFMFAVGADVLKVDSVQTLQFDPAASSARACASAAQTLATFRFYLSRSPDAAITAADELLPEDVSAQLRAFMQEEETRGGDADNTCYGWRVVSREPWVLEEVHFVDGVEQPDENPSSVQLFPIGATTLRLRLPT